MEKKYSSASRVKFSIVKALYTFVHMVYLYLNCPSNENELVSLVEKCQHDMRVIQVNLFKPPPSIVTLNADGSALENSEKIGDEGS